MTHFSFHSLQPVMITLWRTLIVALMNAIIFVMLLHIQ